jgi:Holliday junction resolvase
MPGIVKKKKVNGKRKGRDGELELSNVLKEYGFSARRGQQYAGANGDADVVGIPGVHIEAKRVEKLNIDEAMKQAVNDAREGEIPVVMHRKNRQEWKVTMLLKDFVNLYKEGNDGKE